ncbi:hypothetical protein M9H77_11898 [Catharanthus roseus]|uniref:Uncharacterized protein n=1 Tax=Catharanthus roseus TaxID=4058 RepID=A0ACC0BFX4_CATRO|nr:hypothetical protein M9H77_11898 [Catharanthus roseus]
MGHAGTANDLLLTFGPSLVGLRHSGERALSYHLPYFKRRIANVTSLLSLDLWRATLSSKFFKFLLPVSVPGLLLVVEILLSLKSSWTPCTTLKSLEMKPDAELLRYCNIRDQYPLQLHI